jgi:DNA-binding NtrC family response regulator
MDERVLLVDDEKDFVEAMAERMRARGMEVTATTSPGEALKKAREESYDAIVMDFMMPEIDGLKALKELKKINPDLQIILLTGYATMEKNIEAKNLGAMDLVEKPADIDTLTDKIRKAHKNKSFEKRPKGK